MSSPWRKGKPNGTSTNLYVDPGPTHNAPGLPDRCTDEGFGAITLDNKGVMHFTRGQMAWVGPQGPTQRVNETWPEMTGPIDAAFRSHHKDKPLEHERVNLFKGTQVWSYFDGKLLSGFPRPISQEFPGIPDHLDAAVECHRGECRTDSVIFFKGETAYIYNSEEEPAVKQRRWATLGNCTAAIRWLGRYYCFSGTNFTRFDPVTGQVLSPKPLDTRDYFVRCPGRGHGHAARQNATLMALKDRCSNQSFEAFTSDDISQIYAYRGGWFFRIDSRKDGWHAWPLSHTWRNLHGVVDAAFAYKNRMYFIQ
ncbi:heme transporter activity, partial [Pristimantis euphronides]